MEKLMKKHPGYYKTHPKYNQLRMQYNDNQKMKSHAINLAKKKYHDKINKYLQESKLDDKLSWRLLNQHKNTSQSHDIPPLFHNNKTHYDAFDQAQILHDTLTNPPQPKYHNDHKVFHDKITRLTNNIDWQQNDNNTDPHSLNHSIQAFEITNCINELDPNKAIGPDKIHNKMLIQAHDIILNELLILFNKCLSEGCYPQIWNYSNIHPIQKPKNYIIFLNYRPIAVSSCLGKIFEKLLARCILL